MSHHDESPYIVIVRRSGGAAGFLFGALIGAGIALLFAPRSGRDMRNDIRAGALRLRDRAEDAVRGVTENVTDTIGDVRGEVEGRIGAAREAFEAGRRAARQSRRDMEERVRDVHAGGRAAVDAARRPSGASQATEPARSFEEGDDVGGI
jgi:gas vesicle protein